MTGVVLGKMCAEVLSLEPRISIYRNFLSKEECEHLIALGKPYMQRSKVRSGTLQGTVSSSRTSTGTFLSRGHDNIVRAIEKRIADFTSIPVEHGENLQVLHYEIGQKFDAHCDYFSDEINIKNGGQRMATVLMYLSDVEEGGETTFPSAKVKSARGKRGLTVKPKMGDALLFWNMKPDGTVDPLTSHAACPVIRGEKWACTKWLHVKEYNTYTYTGSYTAAAATNTAAAAFVARS